VVSLVAVGDNTVDRYIDLNLMFPGGNAVNVSVFFKRLGGVAGYVGWVGNDQRGSLVLNSLRCENVDISQCKLVNYPTGYADIKLLDGDRCFIRSDPGARKFIDLKKDNYEYISKYDLVHTSIYSFIEPYLPELSEVSKYLSFDYSNDWNIAYLEQTLPYFNSVFLSSPDLCEKNLVKLTKWIHGFNEALVVITRGVKGSIVFNGIKLIHQNVIKTNVIDTLGAGDSYIARILFETQQGADIEKAAYLASISSAETCTYYGAWGYGIPINGSKNIVRKQ